jgi:uncharacterized membrane protein
MFYINCLLVNYILNLKSDYMTGFSLERMVEGMRCGFGRKETNVYQMGFSAK